MMWEVAITYTPARDEPCHWCHGTGSHRVPARTKTAPVVTAAGPRLARITEGGIVHAWRWNTYLGRWVTNCHHAKPWSVPRVDVAGPNRPCGACLDGLLR
jgi:hypothetical protein